MMMAPLSGGLYQKDNMAYNVANGIAVKDNDIMLYTQLKGTFFKAITKNIDAKVAAATLIYTTDGGSKRFHPAMIRVLVSAANTVTVVPTISIGTNASTYNDLLAATALTGMTNVNNMTNYNLVALLTSVAVNTGIYVNVSVGATATTCNIDVAIFGDYE